MGTGTDFSAGFHMAAQIDILQQILQVLRVEDLASQYSSTLDKFLYTIFFPVILMLLLVYLLTHRMFPEHKGLSVLLGVSFIIFIVVYPPESDSSLYSAFAPIGTVWYVFVILIGMLWVGLGRIWPRGRGGGGAGGAPHRMPGVLERSHRDDSDVVSKIERAHEKISGEHINDFEKDIIQEIVDLRSLVNDKIDGLIVGDQRGVQATRNNFTTLKGVVDAKIQEYKRLRLSVIQGGRRKYDHKYFEDLVRDAQSMFSKANKNSHPVEPTDFKDRF